MPPPSNKAGTVSIKATSLANVLGPRTAAKISVPYSSAPGLSVPAGLNSRTSAEPNIKPPPSRPPSEKLKARMKMREKPNSTAFSYTKPKAPAAGRTTRSVALKKRARSRSASVGPKETSYAGLCFPYNLCSLHRLHWIQVALAHLAFRAISLQRHILLLPFISMRNCSRPIVQAHTL